jgi:predicted metal-dependent hydrolase
MVRQLKLGDITVDVVLKDIKNIHLSVYPPTGRVRISAPSRMREDTIRVFAVSKLSWIKEQQRKLREQERETSREYLDRESHYVFGKRFLLTVIEEDVPASVELKHSKLTLRVRPGTSEEARQALIDEWYRNLLKETAAPIIARWEAQLGVNVKRVFIQQMKTKWGSCNHRACTIRLNTELAKKPRECLEYLIVHELVHLLQPTHNARFIALMDQYMPRWQFYRQLLNRLPLRHEHWGY